MDLKTLMLLDQCLHEGNMSVAEIARYIHSKSNVADANANDNYQIGNINSTKRVIQKHLKEVEKLLKIQTDEKITLSKKYDNKTPRYSYSDSTFSFFKIPITEKQHKMLQLLIENFAHIQPSVGQEWIETITKGWLQIGDFEMVDNSKIISYEQRYSNKSEVPQHLIDIYDYISDEQVIQIKFADKKDYIPDSVHPHNYILSPAYLKQYNGRWYMYATNNDTKEFSDFALDRISDIIKINDKSKRYIKPRIKLTDIEEHVVGINYDPHEETKEIVLAVNNERYYALHETPLHQSQEPVREHGILDKYAKFGYGQPEYTLVHLKVQINRELINSILRYGKDVVVLEPVELREKVQDIIEIQQVNYKKLTQMTKKSPSK